MHFARFNEVTHDFATRDATPRLEWWNNFESVSAIAPLIGRRTTKTPVAPVAPVAPVSREVECDRLPYILRLVGFVRFRSRIAMRKRNGRTVRYVTTRRERETPSFAAGADEYPRGILGQSIRASASSARIKGNRHAELIRSGREVSWESALPADVAY